MSALRELVRYQVIGRWRSRVDQWHLQDGASGCCEAEPCVDSGSMSAPQGRAPERTAVRDIGNAISLISETDCARYNAGR